MTTQTRSRYQQGRMQSPDNMPEQAWTDTPPLPVNQGIGEQPVSATPVQQPYNIFRNIQLPNVSVSGTNRMNVGSVVPNVGAPNGNVGNVPLVNQQAAQQAMNDAGTLQQQAKQAYQDTEAMIAAQQKSAIPQPQPQTPDPQLAQRAFEQGAADQMAGRYVQQNPQGVSVVPPIAEPTGNGKVPYVDAFNQLQEQKKKEVPTSKDGGRGLTNWIKNNLGGDGTKEGNRRAVQNIIALGNMLRHAANLRGTIHEATPQQIADQNAINEAKWKQEDALEQAQAEKQRQYELKLRQMQDAQKNADRNYDLNKRKADNDEKYKQEQAKNAREKLEMEKELHPHNLAAKVAGAEKAKTDAKKAAIELKYLPKEKQLKLKQIAAQIEASRASAAHSRVLTDKTRKELKDLNKGNGDYVLGGNQGKFSRKKQASPEEKKNIISRAHDLKLISDADWTAVHTSAGWNGGETTKIDDLMAQLIAHAGDEELIRDIFTSNGYEYTPYTPATSLKKGNFK